MIILRQGLGTAPLFRTEFVIEDLIVLLIFGLWAAPRRFVRPLEDAIGCLLGVGMALLAWSTPHPKSTWFVFFLVSLYAIMAARSAIMSVLHATPRQRHFTHSAPDPFWPQDKES